MDIVLTFNGLGNQMSQYAFYLQKKAIKANTRYLFTHNTHPNGFELSRIFNVKIPNSQYDKLLMFAYKLLNISRKSYAPIHMILKFVGFHIVKEARNYDYDKNNFQSQKGFNFYWGGWHSEKNFLGIENIVRNVFTFPEVKEVGFASILNEIQQSNSVSVHVRRGDYVDIKPSDYYQFGGVCSLQYYEYAIDYIKNKIPNSIFYFFSDDIEWCKKKFNQTNCKFIDINHGENSWRDMYLMSMCKHNIIANSSFSWWGAWLNANPNKIVLRPHYFIRNIECKDFYPSKWIEINV